MPLTRHNIKFSLAAFFTPIAASYPFSMASTKSINKLGGSCKSAAINSATSPLLLVKPLNGEKRAI